jgi:sirohydrochlorin cobaltochelatase
MSTTLVLACHGAPPNDFPRDELSEFFGMHARMEHGGEKERAAIAGRLADLEARIRAWPRTPENDPFHAGSVALAQALANAASLSVVLGFNEFCSPTLEEALDQAALESGKVIIVTPMLTSGGEHAGAEIPAAIQRARIRHPRTDFIYAWPYEPSAVAAFLAAQVKRHTGGRRP